MSHQRGDGSDGDRLGGGRRHWLVTSLTVARTHVRRVWRQQAGSVWKKLLLVFLVLLFGLFALGGSYLAYRLGLELAAGDLPVGGRMDLVRGVVASVWVGLTVLVTVRAAGSRGAREAAGGLLWVTPTRPIATGLAAAEVITVLLWIGLPALALSAGFGLGLGSPLPVLTAGLATLVLAITSVAVGYPVGMAIRHVLTRFPFVKRYRTPLVVLGVVAYVAAISFGVLNWLFSALLEPLSLSPMGWLADLALLGTPGVEPSTLLAALAVAQIVVVVPSVVATTRLANRHWFADPVLAEGDEEDGRGAAPEQVGESSAGGAVVSSRPRLERLLASATDRPTAALVTVAYRRAYRAPAKLLYAAMPFFFLLGYVPQILGGGGVPSFTPVMLLLFVTWGAGVAFVLNPLGDQGSVLPATVLSGVSARRFVRAHVLATLLLVLPLGLALTAGAAVASPLDAGETLLLLAATPIVVTAGSLAGVGIGMVAPRFGSVRVSSSTRVVVPSKVAFAGYSVYLVLTAGAGLLVAREAARRVTSFVITLLLPVSVQPETLLVVASVVLVVLLAAPVAGYRYAVSRFETITLESAGA